jgi:hypothetical protein
MSNNGFVTNNFVSLAGPKLLAAADVSLATLSPEGLMAYCSSQLRCIDDQVNTMMQQQQSLREAMNALSAARRVLGDAKVNGLNENGSAAQKAEILRNLAEAARNLPPGEQRNAVLTELNHFRKTACCNDGEPPPIDLAKYSPADIKRESELGTDENKNAVSVEEVKGFDSNLETIANDANRNMELQMIKLQGLISQRQQAISLTTNILQKLNESLQNCLQKW